MENKQKSSNEAHSEPLQQCSVVGSAFDIKWKTVAHMSFGTYSGKPSSYICQRDNNLKVQRESNGGNWYYFIDGDDREFKNEEELLKALKEKV